MGTNNIADIFLEKLKEDSTEYKTLETDAYDLAEKKNAIRSLMNIRMPLETSDELLKVQDAYLRKNLR